MLLDITRDEITECLRQATDSDLIITAIEPVSGGCINQAYCCTTNLGEQFFIKLNAPHKLRMFNTEASGLAALAGTNTIRVPAAIAAGKSASQSFLILEYLSLKGLRNDYEFGAQLAQMHSHSHQKFGFTEDNFIGATPQKNTWHDNWFEFFMQERLEYQCNLLEANSINQQIRSLWAEFAHACERLFGDHSPQPSILHGDLWQGNVAQSGQTVCLFDPAAYYGDAETDLAMLHLFGSPGPEFYRGYSSVRPLTEGFEQRRTFYNLYHVLNHSNLFGSSYSQQAFGMMQQIMAWGGK